MQKPFTVNACPRGHRYPVSIARPTTCPRCDLGVLVSLAYGDCQNPPRGCRSLDFRTESITDFGEFCELTERVGSYNRFRPQVIQREMRPIFGDLMAVEIGREASPVIYAYVPYWQHQAIKWRGAGSSTPISPADRSGLAERFLTAMRRAHADELSEQPHGLRAWWD